MHIIFVIYSSFLQNSLPNRIYYALLRRETIDEIYLFSFSFITREKEFSLPSCHPPFIFPPIYFQNGFTNSLPSVSFYEDRLTICMAFILLFVFNVNR